MKLYYPDACEGVALYQGFRYRYPEVEKGDKLFQNMRHHYFQDAETMDKEDADAIVLMNNFTTELTESVTAYIRREIDAAEALGKPLFLFACGDFGDAFRFDPRAWVFRYSLYKSTMSTRDLCIPMTTEDPPNELTFIRSKQEKPMVAFCGNGAFRSLRWGVMYVFKNVFYECAALFRPSLRARKLGVYWRRALMRACVRSPLIETNFIVRRSFSGHKQTIELDPSQARKEYLETTANADFVLAPKGDGNYSNRFFKTLAFGRIPVLVDTDLVLPLEQHIEYAKIIVRIPMQDVSLAPERVRAWYDALSSEEWKERQKLARDTFHTRLRVDSFFQYFFETVLPTLPL